ncbi:MAG: FtsX-like permease family protein [Defluviimonas sp.]|nr:FtsX-like permease family protein [Defluviimonas sp.]
MLDLKLVRDLWAMLPQVATIALLIASGISVLVMSGSNYLALLQAMDDHYRNERFADAFASLKRAPLTLAERLRGIDGIGVVEPRISHRVRVIRADSEQSIAGRVLSIPARGQPQLNRLKLVSGRWIDPLHRDEVIINAAYAQARHVRPGDAIDVVLNGRMQAFRVAGIALSPEFVFATRSALPLPDDRNFVVLWAGREAVESAFDMTGAFNDAAMTLAPGARMEDVLGQVDDLLRPYGGIGAYGRAEQASHRFLEDELDEQRTMSVIMPAVFFGIAAFLLNVVLGRLVQAQREQIASLRALGYPTLPIAVHYFKLVTVIALLGGVAGLVLGWWFASVVIESYRPFFRFPVLEARMEPWIMIVAVAASVMVANVAAAGAVYRISRLPPAEALHPHAPGGPAALLRVGRHVGTLMPLRHLMGLRSIFGRPVRTALTIVGISLAVPLVLFGLFWFDAIAHMLDVSFNRIERGDGIVAFAAPVPRRALHELEAVPGVLFAEGQRSVAVRLVAGNRSYRTGLLGIAADAELRVQRDSDLNAIAVPASGVMMSRPLAERLGLAIGDEVRIEVMEGKRPVLLLPVERLSDDILGFTVTMEIGALNRAMREGPVVNSAALKIDAAREADVWRAIRRMPMVEASSSKAQWLGLFNDTIAGMLVVGAVILVGFGLTIAVGVVYNSARVALQERAWELASLRILGFTRGEAAGLLLGELAFCVAVAIPLGLALGHWLITLILSVRIGESFQIPAVISPPSYAWAALAVIFAALASALIVRRRVDALDLVAVLKTRD